MCLIAFAWRAHQRYELALVANRDEVHARPSAPAAFHDDAPEVYGGRDLEAGGSWLLASTRRRVAVVTNVRDGAPDSRRPRSRGALVADFVRGSGNATVASEALAPIAGDFGRFNLLLWDGARLQFASNHPGFASWPVAPGRHAMSNGPFDALWPKASRAVQGLGAWLDSPASQAEEPDLAPLFAALADTTPDPDAALPDTGVGLALERFLSPPFIVGRDYGTRCSTVLLVEPGAIRVIERRFGPEGVFAGETGATLDTERSRESP